MISDSCWFFYNQAILIITLFVTFIQPWAFQERWHPCHEVQRIHAVCVKPHWMIVPSCHIFRVKSDHDQAKTTNLVFLVDVFACHRKSPRFEKAATAAVIKPRYLSLCACFLNVVALEWKLCLFLFFCSDKQTLFKRLFSSLDMPSGDAN